MNDSTVIQLFSLGVIDKREVRLMLRIDEELKAYEGEEEDDNE